MGMDRYNCRSGLTISVSHAAGKQTVKIHLKHHTHHEPYFSIDMPPEVLQMLRENILIATPSALVTIIRTKYPQVSAAQIYAAWRKMSESLWKRGDDQMDSASELLKEFEKAGKVDVFSEMKVEEDVTAMAWGLPQIASRIKASVVEVAMDATCEFPDVLERDVC
jgi:hypothetical protein